MFWQRAAQAGLREASLMLHGFDPNGLQIGELSLAFLFSALIGTEREIRQKSVRFPICWWRLAISRGCGRGRGWTRRPGSNKPMISK
ncbi:hypothetical protein MXAZACID_10283 [Acidocella sp. MX-AZ02]|nr:hypothetical protein MXAZACID_10283 [Acidocella sp. MX-AZ02]